MESNSEENYLELNRERIRRMRMVATVMPAGVALLLLVARFLLPFEYFHDYFGHRTEIFGLTVIALLGMSGATLLMAYLQSGFGSKADDLPKSHLRILRERADNQLRALEGQFQEFQERFEDASLSVQRQGALPTEDDRRDIIESVVEKVYSGAANRVLNDLRAQIAEADQKKEFSARLFERFESTADRLRNELSALSRRGNTNLVLGIFTTVIGLLILGYFVLEIPAAEDLTTGLLLGFVPRLSLVMFIELFAYFFLKLYKASLSEIKYFQNEITNVESKAVALWTSVVLDDRRAILAVIEELASTERNNVLEEGQTTVELEQSKLKTPSIERPMGRIMSSLQRSKGSA